MKDDQEYVVGTLDGVKVKREEGGKTTFWHKGTQLGEGHASKCKNDPIPFPNADAYTGPETEINTDGMVEVSIKLLPVVAVEFYKRERLGGENELWMKFAGEGYEPVECNDDDGWLALRDFVTELSDEA